MRPTLALQPRLIVAVALILALAPIVTEPVPAASAPPRSWRHEVQRQLDRIVDKGVPGTIALVRDGRASWAFTSGVSDLARGTPL